MSLILHIADAHIGTVYENLPDIVARTCEKAQMNALRNAVDYAKKNHAAAILIAGNLFAMPVPPQELAQEVFQILESASCKVLIAPGNHDYLHEESPYQTMSFSNRMHVFKSTQLTPCEIDKTTVVWGAAHEDTEEDVVIQADLDTAQCNILLLHADLHSSSKKNWLTLEKLRQSRFDYAALGHEHAYSGIQYAGKTAYAYAGALMGRGFHEPDTHGFLFGGITKEEAHLRFMPADGVTFLIWQQPITNIANDKELSRAVAEHILHSKNTAVASRACDLPAPPEDFSNACLSLTLVGNRTYEPDMEGLLSALDTVFLYTCVENESVPPKDIWRYTQEDDLRGSVTRKFHEKYAAAADNPQEQAQILYALKVTLAAFEGEALPPLAI